MPPLIVAEDIDVVVTAPAWIVPPIAVPEKVMLFTNGDAVKLTVGAFAVSRAKTDGAE